MKDFNKRVYATLEIQKKHLTFLVSKIVNNQLMTVFSKIVENKKNWLDENDLIINKKEVTSILKQVLNEYEINHLHLKIIGLSVIIPSSKIKISENYTNIKLNNENLNIVDKIALEKLKQKAKKVSNNQEYKIMEIKPISWTKNGEETLLKKIFGLPANSIGLNFKMLEIPNIVYESHTSVVKDIGLKILSATLSIDEIYHNNFIDNKNNNVLIANWKENSVEVGYFEKNSLKKFSIIPNGLNDIIESISKTISVKNSEIEKYIYKLIDFSSLNNLQTNICQRWDSNYKILKKYSTQSIKDLITKQFFNIYDEIKWIGKHKSASNGSVFEIHNFGLIEKISGIETLLRQNNEIINFNFVNNESTFGLTNKLFFSAHIGVVKNLELKNNNPKALQIITSLGEVNRNDNFDSLKIEEQTKKPIFENRNPVLNSGIFVNNYNSSSFSQALYLKNQGIIIESKKISKK